MVAKKVEEASTRLRILSRELLDATRERDVAEKAAGVARSKFWMLTDQVAKAEKDLLDAVTGHESASWIGVDQQRRELEVEPLTNYFAVASWLLI